MAAPDPAPLRTPLYDEHVSLGGRMVDFAGYALPVQYGGILEEHRAVRAAAGLFDVSHMAEIAVSGPDALDFLQRLLPADVSRVDGRRVVYTPMCREDGGTVDDLLVYRLGPDAWLLVVNAANRAKDVAWVKERADAFVGRPSPARLQVEDVSDRYAQLALQGPAAVALAARLPGLSGAPLLGRYTQGSFTLAPGAAGPRAVDLLVSRTGYTGEDGLELYLAPESAPALWRTLLALGAVPAGLGARDSLRFEAALPLYGHELADDVTPVEAGLVRFLEFRKPDFSGRAVLLRQFTQGASRRLVGLSPEGRAIPRAGCAVHSGTRPVGHVTSGMFSPTLGKGLGMALVENLVGGAEPAPIPDCAILIHDRPEPAALVPLPFYRRPKQG